MSEKHLTEPPWKALVAKHKVKDNGLQRALLAYGKLDAIKERGQLLESLAEISELAVKLKKANSANKEIAGYLDEVAKEVTRTRENLPAMPTLEQQEDAQESADVRVWLANTLKMVKATENGPPVAFVACVAKPFYGLLLAKNAGEKIGAAHRQALTDFTQGVKFILGNCLFENHAHTFVVDPVPPGLAKELKKAIKEITGQTCKVRVRDSEGKVVVDADTETEEKGAQPPIVETAEAAAASPPAVPAGAEAENNEALNKFKERYKALQPRILKAVDAKSPESEEIKQRAAQAVGIAAKKDFEQATRMLDGIETLLQQQAVAAASSSSKSAPPANDAAVVPRDIKLSTYLSGKANLRTARENAAKELERLQKAILAKCADEPFYKEVEAKSQNLFGFLAQIDDTLVHKLDEAGRCLDPELQVDLNKQVRELIQKQLAGLRAHALSSFVEKNPFGKFIIKQPLEVTLAALDKQLS